MELRDNRNKMLPLPSELPTSQNASCYPRNYKQDVASVLYLFLCQLHMTIFVSCCTYTMALCYSLMFLCQNIYFLSLFFPSRGQINFWLTSKLHLFIFLFQKKVLRWQQNKLKMQPMRQSPGVCACQFSSPTLCYDMHYTCRRWPQIYMLSLTWKLLNVGVVVQMLPAGKFVCLLLPFLPVWQRIIPSIQPSTTTTTELLTLCTFGLYNLLYIHR